MLRLGALKICVWVRNNAARLLSLVGMGIIFRERGNVVSYSESSTKFKGWHSSVRVLVKIDFNLPPP